MSAGNVVRSADRPGADYSYRQFPYARTWVAAVSEQLGRKPRTACRSRRARWPWYGAMFAAINHTQPIGDTHDEEAGLIERFEARERQAFKHSGFSVNAGVRIEAQDRAALVPPPRTHRHRYYGVLAPASPLRAVVTAMAQAGPAQDGSGKAVPARARLARCYRAMRSAVVWSQWLFKRQLPSHPGVSRRTPCGRRQSRASTRFFRWCVPCVAAACASLRSSPRGTDQADAGAHRRGRSGAAHHPGARAAAVGRVCRTGCRWCRAGGANRPGQGRVSPDSARGRVRSAHRLVNAQSGDANARRGAGHAGRAPGRPKWPGKRSIRIK